jgi:hypothetical protein
VDPIFTSLASSLAIRFAQDGLGAAWSALVSLIRRKTQAEPEASAALTAALDSPRDAHRVGKLAQELNRLASLDPDFDAAVRRLWRDVEQTSAGSVQNTISGTVHGGAVQGRDVDISGGVRFGNAEPDKDR